MTTRGVQNYMVDPMTWKIYSHTEKWLVDSIVLAKE